MSVRSSLQRFHIPSYNRNAVVQLIAFTGLGFVAIHLIWITLIVYAVPEQRAHELTFQYIGMGNLQMVQQRWWTIFTFALCHHGFWEWLSNMLWLFAFGNVVQNLIGYKQIIPLFAYSTIIGGLFFTIVQFFPVAQMPASTLVMGAQAGVMGLMAAALTLSFRYRIFLSDYFSVPLLLLAGIFVLLMLLNSNLDIAMLALMIASAATGFGYIKLLQSGYQPGIWVYKIYNKMDKQFDPKTAYKSFHNKPKSEIEIDNILDKISEKGYHALSQKEKDQLREAGR
jgi:membrane associated rhomboid family serine protease